MATTKLTDPDTFHWHVDPEASLKISDRYNRMLEKSMRNLNPDGEYMYKMYHTASYREIKPNPITRLVSRLTYKPNAKVWVEGNCVLVMVLDNPDRDHPERTIPVVSRQQIPMPMIEGEDSEENMIGWVRNCLMQLEEHEMDEWLRLDKKLVNDPHRGEIRVDWGKKF